jgi:carbonic anhydrase/acetyltransferase-like protein (isoleucine patch superfamily)
MTKHRKLTPEEIAALQAQSCYCEDWALIEVPETVDIAHIHHTRFSGHVTLGAFRKEFELPGGLKKHSGLRHVTLHNCTLGDDVLIENVQNYIVNYHIGDGCFIQNVNVLVTEGDASFGNNVAVSVLNETGGREVPIYNTLSASLAYLIALYRHRPLLIERLQDMISAYTEKISNRYGSIGDGVKITNTGTIRNVKIGNYTTIENCTRLENGSINSTKKAPVYVGDSVIAQDFIISSGAVIADAAKLIRCFIGQACHVTHNFSAHDSLLFSNCTFENGEACAIFAGPFTVSMHKSSLLIAGMFSFLNAGSGSNQSNHMYKLGPIHQGIVERGSKTTSDSYILWPAHIGAFSLVMGRHYHHSDTSDIPFSYLIENNDETYLAPGVNLRSVGTVRDAQKWPKRDKRADDMFLDKINYNLLSPYTIRKMIKAIRVLENLQLLTGETSEVYYYQNTRIKGSSLRNGLKLYNMAICKFLGNSLIKRLEKQSFQTMEEVWQRLLPDVAEGTGEWLDLAGLILPQESLDKLLDGIEKGTINGLPEIEQFFDSQYKQYYTLEWTWAYHQIESYYAVSLQSITAGEIIGLVKKWQEAVIDLDHLLYEDARKEFSLTSMISFGVDGSSKEKKEDFEGVRGDFENNPFVAAVKEHIITKQALGDELIGRLEKLTD